MNYIVSDVVIRLKNAVMARRRKVFLPYSKRTKAIAAVLAKEKYIHNIREELIEGKKMVVADVVFANRIPIFTDVKIISKPSLRIYGGKKEVMGRGLGTTVVSTNKGVMTGKEAVEKGLGGEIMFRIW